MPLTLMSTGVAFLHEHLVACDATTAVSNSITSRAALAEEEDDDAMIAELMIMMIEALD